MRPHVLDARINGGTFRQMLAGHASHTRLAGAAPVSLAFNRLEPDDVAVKFGGDHKVGAPAPILHRHLDLAGAVEIG